MNTLTKLKPWNKGQRAVVVVVVAVGGGGGGGGGAPPGQPKKLHHRRPQTAGALMKCIEEHRPIHEIREES